MRRAWTSPASPPTAGAWRRAICSRHFPAAAWTAARFIADAVSRGAVAVLAPEGTVWPPGVPPRPLLEDPEPRRRLAQLAAGLAGSQPRVVVAVTGTNGKTSTVEFLRQIWAAGGRQAASLGTLGLIAPGLRSGPGPDHTRSGGAGRDAGTARPRRRPARRDGGLVARARPVPPRRRAPGGRGVHQPDARPSRLSRLGGRLSGRQAAAVRRTAADRRAGGGKQRHGCGDARRAGRCRDAAGARSSHGRRDRIGDPSAGGRTASRRTASAHRRRQVSGARSCCRCRAGSRPTTP